MRPATADEAALVRAVVTAPEDDAPRLVFADWCDEHGLPDRATMIRRMVAVPSAVLIWNQSLRAFRPRLWHDGTAAAKAIRNLKRDCSTACREDWGRLPVERLTVRRGFATAVRLRWSDFRTLAPSLFAAQPIRSVVLSDLWTLPSVDRPGLDDATVASDGDRGHDWPAAVFPDLIAPARVFYRLRQEAAADLSDRAVIYGRRLVGLDPSPAMSHAGNADELAEPVGRMA
jgi:uncharacterized protein (TIGR02996 family)